MSKANSHFQGKDGATGLKGEKGLPGERGPRVSVSLECSNYIYVAQKSVPMFEVFEDRLKFFCLFRA